MNLLPSSSTPLNRHSLFALENWLCQLGATKNIANPCSWYWILPLWTAEIILEQDEMRVVWEKDGRSTQCCFSYRLSRADIESFADLIRFIISSIASKANKRPFTI